MAQVSRPRSRQEWVSDALLVIPWEQVARELRVSSVPQLEVSVKELAFDILSNPVRDKRVGRVQVHAIVNLEDLSEAYHTRWQRAEPILFWVPGKTAPLPLALPGSTPKALIPGSTMLIEFPVLFRNRKSS